MFAAEIIFENHLKSNLCSNETNFQQQRLRISINFSTFVNKCFFQPLRNKIKKKLFEGFTYQRVSILNSDLKTSEKW